MSRPELAWLSELQRAFGASLRVPLERSSGTLRADTDAYPEALCRELAPGPRTSERARFAVYHRQYWFRLLTALQTDHPLLTRLLGHWEFNGWAARFLVAHPPTDADLARAGDGLPAFLEAALPDPVPVRGAAAPVPAAALLEAAALDGAWRAVLGSPPSVPLDPRALSEAELLSGRLSRRPAFALVEEHWPLFDLRQALEREPGEAPVPLPPRLEAPAARLIGRVGARRFVRPLEPAHAALLRLLDELPLAEALARLEQTAAPGERAELPLRVEAWLTEGAGIGLWGRATP